MHELKTIGHYIGNGSRAQVHAAIVGEERVALKIYRDRAFFKQEKEAYEHLLRSKPSPSLKLPRYFGTFALTESVLSTFEFQPSRTERRQYVVGPCTPYHVALGFEEFSGVGLHTIINDLNDTSFAKLEKELLQTIKSLHDIGICHRDLKADNILLDPTMLEDEQVAMEYMVIDLSEAALKHKTSEHCWIKFQKLDRRNMRGIFLDARAERAARLGFQILSNILPSDRNLNRDLGKKTVIDVETQLDLSRLLKVAYSAPKITSLVNEILQLTTSLVPELCSAVVKILRNHARSSEALALVEENISHAIAQNGRCPQLSRQKGLILQSLRLKPRDAAEAFEFAIAQFSEQLGPLNNATLSTRREYALFRAKIGDRNTATEMLEDILTILAGEKVYTRNQARIIDACSKDIKSLKAFKAPDSSILAIDPK